MVFQYGRIKKALLMSFDISTIDANFSTIYVAQNNDALMNFIWLVKAPQYAPQSDDTVLNLIKSLSHDNFTSL